MFRSAGEGTDKWAGVAARTGRKWAKRVLANCVKRYAQNRLRSVECQGRRHSCPSPTAPSPNRQILTTVSSSSSSFARFCQSFHRSLPRPRSPSYRATANTCPQFCPKLPGGRWYPANSVT
uniref:Uncharacterized protein n=1 Tax=Plectus sambesii TaxID=2011161 RepID=A0A914WFV3_9BILA